MLVGDPSPASAPTRRLAAAAVLQGDQIRSPSPGNCVHQISGSPGGTAVASSAPPCLTDRGSPIPICAGRPPPPPPALPVGSIRAAATAAGGGDAATVTFCTGWLLSSLTGARRQHGARATHRGRVSTADDVIGIKASARCHPAPCFTPGNLAMSPALPCKHPSHAKQLIKVTDSNECFSEKRS